MQSCRGASIALASDLHSSNFRVERFDVFVPPGRAITLKSLSKTEIIELSFVSLFGLSMEPYCSTLVALYQQAKAN